MAVRDMVGAADLHDLLEPICVADSLPALVALVLSGDQIVAQGATGVRCRGSTARVTIQDKLHLGSDTKAMTATLIALLVEDGLLAWSTTVGSVFAGEVERIDTAWHGVTLYQLLVHRGGAPSDLTTHGLWGQLWKQKGSPTEQRLQLARGVLALPPIHSPGSAYLYSNAGYALAGAMAERAAGQAWEELMQERLFRPLGVTSAGFGAPGTPGALDQPLGHSAAGVPVPVSAQADNPPAIAPAGAAHMSLRDWARFVGLHLRGHAANPHRQVRLLRAETFNALHEPAAGPGQQYAGGWLVAERAWAKSGEGGGGGGGGQVLTHAGSNTMWHCVAWVAPERDFALLVATNCGGAAAARACDEAAGALLCRFLQRPA